MSKAVNSVPSHKPPMLGGCAHFFGYESRPLLHVWHIHSYTCFQDSSSPKWCLLLSFWAPIKTMRQKKNPKQAAFIFQSSFSHWEEASGLLTESNWRLLEAGGYNYSRRSLLKEEYLQFLARVTRHGSFFLVSLEIPASLSRKHWCLHGDVRRPLKMATQCILCIFIGLICIMKLSGSSKESLQVQLRHKTKRTESEIPISHDLTRCLLVLRHHFLFSIPPIRSSINPWINAITVRSKADGPNEPDSGLLHKSHRLSIVSYTLVYWLSDNTREKFTTNNGLQR